MNKEDAKIDFKCILPLFKINLLRQYNNANKTIKIMAKK